MTFRMRTRRLLLALDKDLALNSIGV
jgi:hypothetical protein